MCYSAGSITQACPMCKVYSHAKCPHIRDTCTNRAAHPRMDVVFLTNAEVDSFNRCGFCKWAATNPPPKQAGYDNPGWPGCCRPPANNENIPVADWPAVSIVHRVPIPQNIQAILSTLPLPPLPFKQPRSAPSPRTPAPRPQRKQSTPDPSPTPRRSSAPRRPALAPPTPPTPPKKILVPDPAPHHVPRSPTTDDDARSSSSGSSDGLSSLSDSTVTSDGGFTDYLSDESEAELQRQAEAKAAILAQNQREELEFKMARQQLANIGLKPPKSWTQANSSSKKNSLPAQNPSRNANVPPQSFSVAATAIMQTSQARG